MQRRQVQRQTKEHMKTKRSEPTSKIATRPRSILKENPKTDDTKQTNHNIFNLSEFQEWQRSDIQSILTLADRRNFFYETYRKIRPKFNCLLEFEDLFA